MGTSVCLLNQLACLLALGRYLFLFDKVVIVCKRKGYNYELKEIIELLFHKMTDDPMNNKDIKKVGGVEISSAREHFGAALASPWVAMFPAVFLNRNSACKILEHKQSAGRTALQNWEMLRCTGLGLIL